jgi:HEAT repeat protein
VRENAIAGLWEEDDRTLVPVLIDKLKNDPSKGVRSAAALGLGKFAELAQERKLLPRDAEKIKKSLMEVFSKPGEGSEVRRRCLEAIAPFNTPEVAVHIRNAYNDDKPDVKASAIYAMGRTSSPEWLPLIIKELSSPVPRIRYEAVNACAALGGEEAVPYLIPLLDDEDAEVQLAAINAFGEIGGPLAKRALRRCLKNDDDAVVDAAREAIEMLEGLEDPRTFKHY